MWLIGMSSLYASDSKLSTNIPQQSSLIADMYGVQYPPFKFKHRHESVDWRRISAIDVDRVGSELDFVTLQENIMNITFCNMDSEKCPYCQNPLDPVLLKMFRLAQLTIEYLLHSQEYLTSNLQIYEEKLQAADSEKEQIKKEFCKLSEEIKSQKEECKRRKQIISSQQMMIQAGANNYHKCQYCDKSFMSHFFKQNHVQRRHQEQIDVGYQKKMQTDKIQDEMDQLKKQLLQTQSQLEVEEQKYSRKEFQELENRAMKEEEIKRFEKWKEEEKKKLNDEMEKIKQMFIVEFKEMSAKNSALESELMQIKSTSLQLNLSLSALKNEHEHEIQEERHQYQQKVQELKELLEKQESKWTSEIQNIHEKHDSEKQTLQLEIRTLMSSINKKQKATACYYKKKIKELSQKLYDQHQLITNHGEVQTCAIRPPKKILELSSIITNLPQRKSLTKEQAASTLESIEELCEDEEMKELMELSRCKKNLKNVLKQNPSVAKELRKILEHSLEEKLENLGIKSDVQGISEGRLSRILQTVDSQREEKSKSIPNFYLFRENLAHEVENKILQQHSPSSKIIKTCSKRSTSGKKTVTYRKVCKNKSSGIVQSFETEQPTCSIRKIVPCAKPSTATLSSTTSSDDSEEELPKLSSSSSSSDTTSSESSKLSDVCELMEVVPCPPKQPISLCKTKDGSTGSAGKEAGICMIEPAGGISALQMLNQKKASREMKSTEYEKNLDLDDDDVWDISSLLEEDKHLTVKGEKDTMTANKNDIVIGSSQKVPN